MTRLRGVSSRLSAVTPRLIPDTTATGAEREFADYGVGEE